MPSDPPYSKAYAQGVEECHIDLAMNGIKNGKSLSFIADMLSIKEGEVKTLIKKRIASLLEISFDDTEALIKVLSD